jgi:hypothetical protein
MQLYHLDMTLNALTGPTQEQIVVQNQWAATALDCYHSNSKVLIELDIDGSATVANLEWDSNISKATMKEKTDMAHFGGIALAWFVMSVLSDFHYVEQTEIGTGCDYRFRKVQTSDDDLNFLDDFHYVEISGILEESPSNTLTGRIKRKHEQLDKGGMRGKTSSVVVTLFSQPKTVKQIHR